MRVLYSFPDVLGKPGIGTTAYYQVEGLIAEGVDVFVHCTSARRLPDGVAGLTTTLQVSGRRIPHRALGVARAYRLHDLKVARAIASDRIGIDVVHCWPRAVLATAAAARKKSIPVLREVPNTHTAFAFETVAAEARSLGLAPPRGHSHSFDKRLLAREQAEYDATDLLLVPSEFSRQTFLERGVDELRLVLHDYGYDPLQFWPADGARPDDRPFTAVFVGRCEPRKGLHYALRAWARSGDSSGGRFLVCGTFDAEYRRMLAPFLRDESVECIGFSDDVASVLRASDVLVLPSVEEGSALVTYEAQACGCVLLVSDAAGARAEDGRHGFVHGAGDVSALTEHMRALRDDRVLLAALRAHVITEAPRLTWREAGRRLHSVYAAALS